MYKMNIESFARKYHLKFTSPEMELYKLGEKIMRNGVDNLHDINHVYRQITLLEAFLKENPHTLNKYGQKVVIMAMCWHDTWKSKRNFDKLWQLPYAQIMDGIGSMLMFKSYSVKYKVSDKLVSDVSYAIRKHSLIQIFPRVTLESRVLSDIDNLEMGDAKRFYTSGKFKFLYKYKLIFEAYFIWLNYMLNYSLYFTWSKNQFKKRITEFYDLGNKLRSKPFRSR